MNPRLFENIRISAQNFVKIGVTRYEENFGKFKIDVLKQKFIDNALKIVFNVVDRIYENEEISIIPLRDLLLETLFDLEFNSEAFTEIYSQINKELILFIQSEPNYDANIPRIFNEYLDLILNAISDYSFYSGSEITNILQNLPEYQYSEDISSFYPLEVVDNKIYTLFPKERYWEVFSITPQENAYSPLSYNRVVSAAGFPKYKINFSYDDLLVYNEKLYKLKPDVGTPTREVFDESDWIEYVPRRFDRSKSFKNVYLSNIRSIFGKISEDGFDINNIISDSFIEEYSLTSKNIRANDDFVHSFGGVGRQLIEIAEQLNLLANSLGGYEGSLVGGLEYISKFSQYLLLSAFGKNSAEELDLVDGVPTFGRFNVLFASRTSENKIPGLKFLDGFIKLKSFVHNQTLSFEQQSYSRVTYNPVYEQFYKGISDSFEALEPKSTYSEGSKVDLLFYAIELLYRRSNIIGDLVQAGINSLDLDGKSPGYEGLGSIEFQLKKLQNVFPPSRFFLEYPEDKTVGPGLTGMLRYLRNNYSKFSQGLTNPLLPGRSLEFFLPWVDKISNKLEEMLDILENVGIGSSSFIPNLSFKTFLYNDKKLIDFLTSIGFRSSEIDQLLNINNFTQLVSNFAPLSDSSDLKSFFRAYELSELIYEIGGEEGIDAYLSFLYSVDPIDSLLNILDISTKDKSTSTYINLEKYPRLIGLLIGLTYAVDPAQLIKFTKILGANNLQLIESITLLFQQGENTIIKSPEEIQLLRPVIEQIVEGTYSKDAFASPSLDYHQANKTVPIALKQWTKVIGDNLGRVTSPELIHDLYDRSVGLTPKELISILNYPDSPNIFSGVVDAFNGGKFTKFLKYVNISGLGFKLGFYKNSYQVNNFELTERSEGSFFRDFLLETKNLIEGFSIFRTVFTSSLDYNFEYDQRVTRSLNPFVKAQNKEFYVIPELLQNRTLGASIEQLEILAADAPILESPGIGNSRLPNRIPASNSLTSEQANVLLSSQQELLQLTSINQQTLSLISNYIKFSSDNLLANTLQIKEEVADKIKADFRPRTFTGATKYEIEKNLELISQEGQSRAKQYSVPSVYQEPGENVNVKSSGLGINYISNQTQVIVDNSIQTFDPIKSCQRFGGSNCAELYSNVSDRCVNVINKSLFPEEYIVIPGVAPNVVIIDRPLGTFAEYKPSNQLVPINYFANPPSYYDLLPQNTIPGPGGEPILEVISSTPLIFESGGGDVSEYDNTEFGITEFISASLEKNSEFGCAGYESPFYYQICMNIMKCKRFNPPLEGENFLDFCPKTLSGGRLK